MIYFAHFSFFCCKKIMNRREKTNFRYYLSAWQKGSVCSSVRTDVHRRQLKAHRLTAPLKCTSILTCSFANHQRWPTSKRSKDFGWDLFSFFPLMSFFFLPSSYLCKCDCGPHTHSLPLVVNKSFVSFCSLMGTQGDSINLFIRALQKQQKILIKSSSSCVSSLLAP